MILQIIAWILAILVMATAVALSATAIRFHKPKIALVATLPVLVGLLGVLFNTGIPAPEHAVGVIAGLLVALLGIIGGSPITVAVLAYAGKGSGSTAVPGTHGGIIVNDRESTSQEPPREALRGGTIVGYLERLALIVAIVLGRLEIVAVLIAIKGLGRFSELVSAEIRERFIIGTMVSLVWAGACALLIVL